MAEQLRVFVSHSHQDNAFCHAIVAALRDAGADVWYDEHNLGAGRLGPTIERELRDRSVFVVIRSPAALRSQWVEDETRWAYGLLSKDAQRIILPVIAATIAEGDIWLLLQDFKRIEAPGCMPFPVREAANRLLHALAMTSAGAAPAHVASQPTEDVDDLLTRGKALMAPLLNRLKAQEQCAEALRLFERATQLTPNNADAWANFGTALVTLSRHKEALVACDRALALDDKQAQAWAIQGVALDALDRGEEALAAYDRALALNRLITIPWTGFSDPLSTLKSIAEMQLAMQRSRRLGR